MSHHSIEMQQSLSIPASIQHEHLREDGDDSELQKQRKRYLAKINAAGIIGFAFLIAYIALAVTDATLCQDSCINANPTSMTDGAGHKLCCDTMLTNCSTSYIQPPPAKYHCNWLVSPFMLAGIGCAVTFVSSFVYMMVVHFKQANHAPEWVRKCRICG